MQKLMEEIEKYGFECDAGPLANCIPWQKLKEEILLREAISVTRTKLAE